MKSVVTNVRISCILSLMQLVSESVSCTISPSWKASESRDKEILKKSWRVTVSPHRRAGSLRLARGLVTPQDRAFQPITVPSSQGPWRARSAHMRNRYSSTCPLTAAPPGGRSLGRQPSHREPAGGMAPAMTVLFPTVLPSTWNIYTVCVFVLLKLVSWMTRVQKFRLTQLWVLANLRRSRFCWKETPWMIILRFINYYPTLSFHYSRLYIRIKRLKYCGFGVTFTNNGLNYTNKRRVVINWCFHLSCIYCHWYSLL